MRMRNAFSAFLWLSNISKEISRLNISELELRVHVNFIKYDLKLNKFNPSKYIYIYIYIEMYSMYGKNFQE